MADAQNPLSYVAESDLTAPLLPVFCQMCRAYHQPEEPHGTPQTGPHPHYWREEWRDDGKCRVKSCGVYRPQPQDHP